MTVTQLAHPHHVQPARACILIHHRDPERPRQPIAGGIICRGHYKHLEKMIAESPALDADLVSTHNSTGAAGERVSSSRTPGLRMDEDAIAARARLRLVLVRWADAVALSRGFTRPAGAPLETVCAFLLRNLTWSVAHAHAEWLPAYFDELVDAHRHARRIVQPAAKPHTVDVAPCVEARSCNAITREPDPCPGTLRVTFHPIDKAADPDTPPPAIWCPECGVTYAAQSWYRLGQRANAAAGR